MPGVLILRAFYSFYSWASCLWRLGCISDGGRQPPRAGRGCKWPPTRGLDSAIFPSAPESSPSDRLGLLGSLQKPAPAKRSSRLLRLIALIKNTNSPYTRATNLVTPGPLPLVSSPQAQTKLTPRAHSSQALSQQHNKMTLKTLTIAAMLCGTASAGYSISSMLTTRRKKTPGTAGSIRGAAAPDGPSEGRRVSTVVV